MASRIDFELLSNPTYPFNHVSKHVPNECKHGLDQNLSQRARTAHKAFTHGNPCLHSLPKPQIFTCHHSNLTPRNFSCPQHIKPPRLQPTIPIMTKKVSVHRHSSPTYHANVPHNIHAPIRHHATNTHNPHNKRNTRAKRRQQPTSACTIVKNNTIIPSTQNIEKIHATKQPHNRKTLRSFLKAVNAYKKFIPDHARLRTPLVNLLKRDIMWVWSDECQKAFTNLKESLTTHPTLYLYQEDLPCQVYCNTSTFGIAGILKQVYPDGKTYPVQHFSRSLRGHERNYSDLELQCLAIVESVDNFRACLMGRKFTILSDHPALPWLKEIKAPSGRLFRWRLRLSRYEYEVLSINGVQQYETGVVTRIPFCGFLDAPLIKSQQSSPPGKSRVTMDHNELRTVSRKCVLKTIVPSSLTARLLKSVHTQHHHPNISKMTRLISSQYYWQNMTQDIAKQVKTCPTCRFARRIDESNQPSLLFATVLRTCKKTCTYVFPRDAAERDLACTETFDFSTPNEWPKWRKRFERYLVVSGMKKKEEADKIDLFMYLMGDRADDIFRTFKFEKEEEATKIDSVLKAFDSHFCVRKNIIYERAKFNSRIQEDREPVDEFITSLYKLADSCEFEGLHEQLIRDRIVVGVRDKALSERMQLDSELTLEKAVKMVRQQEAVRQQQVDLQRPSTSQKVNQVEFNSKKQSPKQQQQPSRKKEKSAKTRSRCPKCGGFTHREGQACRAEGQKCNLCSKIGHLANCCPDKQAKTAEFKAVYELDEEIGVLLEVSAVGDSSKLDDDEGECRRRWTAEIQVNGKRVKFKLDSQADVTCVPLCLFKKIMGQQRLVESDINIRELLNSPNFRLWNAIWNLTRPRVFSESYVNNLARHGRCNVLPGRYPDICLHSKTHDRILRLVLRKLKEAKVTLNKAKCVFGVPRINFLGHILDEDGIRPDPAKIEAVAKMPAPTDVHGVRRFLGMVNHLGRFVDNLSEIVAPLNQLLVKGQDFVWDCSQERAFRKLKELLTTQPILAAYDVRKPTMVSSDASSYGLGAVLKQEGKNGIWRPVAYSSRTMTPTEKRYAQIEKEALAITWACERFQDFLLGKRFRIETDHKPLIPLFSTKELSSLTPRLQRFRMRMMRFGFEIVHIPGKELLDADALSRQPLLTTEGGENERQTSAHINAVLSSITDKDEMLTKIFEAQQEDTTLKAVVNYLEQGWPDKKKMSLALLSYWHVKDELGVQNGLLMRSCRLVIPASMKLEILDKLHARNFGITKTRLRARETVWWPGISEEIAETVRKCSVCIQEAVSKHEPLIPTNFPTRPWQKIGNDLFKFENKWYLVVIDYYSRFPEVVQLDRLTANVVVRSCKSIFARHGIPKAVVSDNGTQFGAAREFANFARQYGFTHVTSSPRFPQSNGMAEAGVKIAKLILKKNQDPSLGLLEYRSTPLENGYSPAELLMGRKLRTTLPIAPENLNPKLVDSQTLKRKEGRRRKDMKSRYDRRCGAMDMEELSEGDTVWITDMQTWGIVKQKASTPRSYMVDTPVGTLRRNRFHLRKGVTVQYPADPSTPTFSGEELVENEKTPVVDYPSNDSEDGQIRTRSIPCVKCQIPSCVQHALKSFQANGEIQTKGSSRTDKGVHAMMNTFHVDLTHPYGLEYPCEELKKSLNNKLLEHDHEIQAPPGFTPLYQLCCGEGRMPTPHSPLRIGEWRGDSACSSALGCHWLMASEA
ncbi:K02A2.6-like, partial [Cordylochernes scorpioides]